MSILKEITNQLRAVLPKYTNNFSVSKNISSLTSIGDTVTAISASHGYFVGDYVLIKDAKVPYSISSLTRVGTQATAITSESNQVIYKKDDTVEITGAIQNDYNGTKTLIEPKKIKITSLTKVGNTITAVTEEEHGFIVNANFKINIWGAKEVIYNQTEIVVASIPTTTSFIYTVEGETTSPATALPVIFCQAIYTPYVFFFTVANSPATPATGTIYQLWELNDGYNGLYSIASVPDINTFTYTMNLSSLNSPAQGTITSNLSRIDSAISSQRANEAYTKQASGKYWLFVVPNTEIASKNRNELTDATYVYKNGNAYLQTVIFSFDLLLFIPSPASLANGDSYDFADDMKRPIFKSLLGAPLVTTFYQNGNYKTTGISYIGSSPEFSEQNVYYAHRLSFELTFEIQPEDIIDENDLYAFRRVTETYVNKDSEDLNIETDILLD